MSVEDSLRSLSLDCFNLLVNGQVFSDVTFSIDGRLVHAHRCILAARSHFFRKFFFGTDCPLSPTAPPAAATTAGSPRGSGAGMVITVTSVGYEVFLLVLQFLYSGQVSPVPQKHETRSDCGERGCWHTHCSSSVDLALKTLSAARSFGVEQLIQLIQKQLMSMVEKASIEDVMKVLIASRKHEMHQLWTTCSHLVAKWGLRPEILSEHLPVDVVAKMDELRLKSSNTRRSPSFLPHPHHQHSHRDLGSEVADLEDQKIIRMRRALNSSDVELVKLMVVGEGLNLDKALALHYAVKNCSREVVKALLELGAADVNFPEGPSGKTPLHIAAEMVSPDMVAVLIDHHADPTIRTVDGVSPVDILRAFTSDFLFKGAVPGLNSIEPNKLRLCLELVQSAALVISREEAFASSGTSSAATTTTSILYRSMSDGHSSSDSISLNLDSRSIMYVNPGAHQAGPRINRDHDRGRRSRDQSLYHHHQPHEF
ncbi:hypothetical protein SAY87_011029 [Trapa incisa]|uniref:Uncharacterized protein n=1 Tax=Trapa incisa TaxID=236973 RepID=A0AAN7GXC5_9MYRT|nr:hypothetical protein SAY87_011029 [Trapa incisa]